MVVVAELELRQRKVAVLEEVQRVYWEQRRWGDGVGKLKTGGNGCHPVFLRCVKYFYFSWTT